MKTLTKPNYLKIRIPEKEFLISPKRQPRWDRRLKFKNNSLKCKARTLRNWMHRNKSALIVILSIIMIGCVYRILCYVNTSWYTQANTDLYTLDVEGLLAEFVALVNILDALNIEYAAAAGTLIGAIRNHGFIPHDDDIDIITLIDNKYKLINNETFIDLLTQNDLHYKTAWHTTHDDQPGGLQIFQNNRTKDFHIDIFFISNSGNKGDDKRYHYLPDTYPYERWPYYSFCIEDVFPVKYAPFEDFKIPIPNNPEKVLDAMFGIDWWRTAKKPWHITYKLHHQYLRFREKYWRRPETFCA